MDDLGALLREAVEDVEPAPRARELSSAVAAATRRRHRQRLVAGAVAAAVLVTGGAVAAQRGPGPDSEPEPAGPSHAIDHEKAHAVYGIYYVGSTPEGPRLYRELRTGTSSEQDLNEALAMLATRPADPDYRAYWSEGQLLGATVQGGVIQVDVDPARTRDAGAVPVPALAVQELVYTAQGVVGERLPVQFVHDGNPVAEVFGQPTSEPLTNAAQLDVLALASISDPSERQVVTDAFSAEGVASSFEGNVPWELRGPDGTVVRHGTAQTYGWVDRLYPWSTGRIDLAGLDPGEYTFVVRTDDPSGGAEGHGPTVDTRTVIIK